MTKDDCSICVLLLDFALLRTSSEIIKAHCEASGQVDEFQQAGALCKVARVARNLVSHVDGAVLTAPPSVMPAERVLRSPSGLLESAPE